MCLKAVSQKGYLQHVNKQARSAWVRLMTRAQSHSFAKEHQTEHKYLLFEASKSKSDLIQHRIII